ncbi:30S ribosomal protein S16 [Candidatus Roizmanbacteria bacterium RIFCSPHIGHO2_01_FULL_39_8]|uniref:Small ribosomal subunit protein bS16 n=3 Tax=Candidatus Roizmaniibacteriota TaxID=1752723 RepID=A0A1F7GRZ4_9BACT|nr:MAG: 30S ribosomal protein S16 [Candidatus Roizmanbacteria bacterium RIFCSPHIGHO2_01_FULL_39_8]OGK26469.1 MAG: 30S ribosomal protein S16 [Candidatus Roizmanbacteria bacterium RIFCSPHIGHO2_02_FULL_39_9]OGK36034.1 MAG: 30S ribosomal protein S16 [Candidatus Roizmanbacteria bacterium RIFCSPHIGHO2_12_FULL_39_8]
MAVAIKLMRLGKKGKPFYRIVVMDKRKKRNGAYLENLGTYDPKLAPAKLEYDKDKLKNWLSKGAILTEGLRKLLGKNVK